MSQIDSVTLGESASVVSPCDEALYAAAKDIVWQAAMSESGAHSGTRKLTVDIIRARNQTLIFGIIYIENVKVIPTFRINFLKFPWQLLGASGPAGFTRLSCIVTKFM